jgi:hypothetical protein
MRRAVANTGLLPVPISEITATAAVSSAISKRAAFVKKLNRRLSPDRKVLINRAHYTDARFVLVDADKKPIQHIANERELVRLAASVGALN